MLYLYTTDNVTQNQDTYDSFIQSFIPFLSCVPCPKCRMVGFLILYGSHPRCFINEDMIRIKILIQRIRCTHCGSTHIVLPTTVFPYFLHCILNIKNALFSDTEMNITYRDYLKCRFRNLSFDFSASLVHFTSIIRSILKNRNVFFDFFILPT